MTDLSLVPTAALVGEFFRRHDHAAIIGRRDISTRNGAVAVNRQTSGDAHIVAGLLLETATMLIVEHLSTAREAPPEFGTEGGGDYGQESET